jgi:hypothetical protein
MPCSLKNFKFIFFKNLSENSKNEDSIKQLESKNEKLEKKLKERIDKFQKQAVISQEEKGKNEQQLLG